MTNPFPSSRPMNQDSNPDRLFVPVSQRDRYQGILNAPVVLVEYGNYQCPQCKELHQSIQAIQQHFDLVLPQQNWVCVVFRHFIQNSIYPQARKAAQAAEVAAAQGQFWQMHDMLFTHQQELGDGYLVEYANNLGLDIPQFLQDISRQVHISRINADIEGGLKSGVEAAPALFINEIRYLNRWTIEQIMAAIVAASDRGF